MRHEGVVFRAVGRCGSRRGSRCWRGGHTLSTTTVVIVTVVVFTKDVDNSFIMVVDGVVIAVRMIKLVMCLEGFGKCKKKTWTHSLSLLTQVDSTIYLLMPELLNTRERCDVPENYHVLSPEILFRKSTDKNLSF